MAGVTITLDGTTTATTGADGAYQFLGIANGDYTVVITVPNGFVSTTSSEASVTVSDISSSVANFGLKQAVPTAISGSSFITAKSNTNGLWLVILLSVAFMVTLGVMTRKQNS